MKLVRDGRGTLIAIELAEAEMREMVALEATRTVLCGGPGEGAYSAEYRREFLGATQRYYALRADAMAPFLAAERLSRGETLDLQILKRKAQGKKEAVEVLERFRALEETLGDGILKIYVSRSQRYAAPPPSEGETC